VYGPTIARDYVTEASVDGSTEVCLYCHPTTAGEVVTKSFGLEMMQRGLRLGSPDKLRELLDALMAELDAVAEPLGPDGAALLDTDADEIPDALEIRWGADPSSPDSYLVVDPDSPGAYVRRGKEPPTPISYGCGAQLSPSAPQSLGWPLLLAVCGVVVCGRHRRSLRLHRKMWRTSSTTSGNARGARLPPYSTT
jgi:hypothetical protein